jgi:hypothetical protein
MLTVQLPRLHVGLAAYTLVVSHSIDGSLVHATHTCPYMAMTEEEERGRGHLSFSRYEDILDFLLYIPRIFL